MWLRCAVAISVSAFGMLCIMVRRWERADGVEISRFRDQAASKRRGMNSGFSRARRRGRTERMGKMEENMKLMGLDGGRVDQ